MKELRQRFVMRTISDRTLLVAAIHSGDWSDVRRLAHGLSGSAGVFGFSAVGLDAQALEEAIDAGEDKRRLLDLGLALLDRLERVDQTP